AKATSATAARTTRFIAECSRRLVGGERRGLSPPTHPAGINPAARRATESLLDGHLVMDVESGLLFFARRRGAAEVSRVANDLVAERLAGKRVAGQRHGNLGQGSGQGPVVVRGVEPQRLDVAQQRDPLVQPPLPPM